MGSRSRSQADHGLASNVDNERASPIGRPRQSPSAQMRHLPRNRGPAFAFRHLVLKTVSLSWSELARRTWREVVDDDVMGLAAQLSYYFFLALFPAILFLLALASFFPLSNITDDVGRSLGPFVSPQVLELIQEQMRRLANNENGGLLTFGVAGALWSSSAALVSIVGALNRAYDIEEGRPWWKVRLIAIGLTLGVAAIVLVALIAGVRRPHARRDSSDKRLAGARRLSGRGWSCNGHWCSLWWPRVSASSTTSDLTRNRTGCGSRRAPSPPRFSGW